MLAKCSEKWPKKEHPAIKIPKDVNSLHWPKKGLVGSAQTPYSPFESQDFAGGCGRVEASTAWVWSVAVAVRPSGCLSRRWKVFGHPKAVASCPSLPLWPEASTRQQDGALERQCMGSHVRKEMLAVMAWNILEGFRKPRSLMGWGNCAHQKTFRPRLCP